MSYDPSLLEDDSLDGKRTVIRFMLQDNIVSDEYLVDAEYNFLINKADGDVEAAALSAGYRILSSLAQRVDHREGQIEVRATGAFSNYKDWLENFLEDELSTSNIGSLILVGGVNKTVVNANDADPYTIGAKYKVGSFYDQLVNGETTDTTTSDRIIDYGE